MTSDFVGLFEDGHSNPTFGYNKIGESMVKLVEGDDVEGILELITVNSCDWGYDTSVFARYSVDLRGNGVNDDHLTIEYFSSLPEAQAGFSEAALVYQRFTGFFDRVETILYIVLGSAGALVVVIAIIVTAVVIRKKKVRFYCWNLSVKKLITEKAKEKFNIIPDITIQWKFCKDRKESDVDKFIKRLLNC